MVGLSQVSILESCARARVNSLKAAGDLFKLAKEIFIVFKDGKSSRLALSGKGTWAGGSAVEVDIRRQAPFGLGILWLVWLGDCWCPLIWRCKH